MTHKVDIASEGNDIHFSESGTVDASGLSEENKVESPSAALAIINAFDDPPDSSNPASIITTETGSYSTGLVIPDFVKCSCSNASITTDDDINLKCGSSQTSTWSGLVNSKASGGICVEIDGESRVRPIINLGICQGDNSMIINVTGECDDIFPDITQALIGGDGSVLITHTATSRSPIKYKSKLAEFNGTNQTALVHSPAGPTAETIYDLGTIQPNVDATDTSGSRIGNIVFDDAVMQGEVLKAETLFDVQDGARIILTADFCAGDSTIFDGGEAIYRGLGILNGSVEVQSGGFFDIGSSFINGTITIPVGAVAVIRCGTFIGSIPDVEGELDVIIQKYIGTLPADNGSIKGMIGDTFYGPKIFTSKEPDTIPLLTHTVTGTNGAISRSHYGTRDPKGNVTGNPGDYYNRSNGVLTRIYQHRGASANNIDWVNISDAKRETILVGSSLVDQPLLPGDITTDQALQITFGASQFGPTDPVQLSAAGAVTANITDQYYFDVTVQFGRTGAGSASLLFFRLLVNGTQSGQSVVAKIDNSNTNLATQFNTRLDLVATDVVTLEFIRDSSGFDSGSLFTDNPVAAGWSNSPSAHINVSRRILL